MMIPRTPKRTIAAAVVVTLLAALTLAACGSDDLSAIDPGNAADAPDFASALAHAPPRLAALYANNGGGLVDGGQDAFDSQIAALHGYPVVINKWASWCGPCRFEFPSLQSQAAQHLDEVAFVGINAGDSTDAAETFLRDHPIPYPSFSDPNEEISRSFGATEFPTTIFLDRDGNVVHIQRGVYSDEATLAADIQRYALGSDPLSGGG